MIVGVAALVLAAVAAGCEPAAPPGGPSAGPPDAGSPGATGAPPASAADDAEARELVGRIVQAESTLAYHGWRAVSQGRPGESRETRLRVARPASGPVTLTWASPGSGSGSAPGRSDAGADAGAADPSAAAVRTSTADRRFPWTACPDLLVRNYRVVLESAPGEPVAWRDTRRVRLEGRRPGRPSLVLLVDAETWLVLAESYRDAAGLEWRNARFETIEYSEPALVPPGSDRPASEPRGAPVPGDGGRPELAVRAVAFVPEGFERVAAAWTSCGSWREDFSDGLAGVSVLQARAADGAPPEGEVSRRQWLGGASVSARVGRVAVTVTGTLPADELLRILRGLGATDVTTR